MNRRVRAVLALCIILQVVSVLNGCAPARQKMHDVKQYFLNDVMRW